MTEALYMNDCYLTEFEAYVIKVEGNKIFLDKTAFYPTSGGVECDKGEIIFENQTFKVIDVKKENGEIVHYLDKDASDLANKKIIGKIDWNRRYKLMKLHTAAHIISAILYKEYNVLITGGNISEEYARDDFNLPSENWKEIVEDCVKKANKIVEEGRNVKIYFLKREEAFKIPGIVKLAEKMPPNLEILRIVEIEGIDIQADGGPHVKNTKEIGKIKLIKAENKGKNNRRIYYTVE
ncbi:MAG: alanyl-tRNA editing protein AlaXM [Candidatus Aenigmatarchaeota archaeon]